MSEINERKLFLLDAYALIFRSYYAFIRNPRINSKGMNTSAIFGFMLTLDEILQNQDPSHIAVIFDPPGPTFRHEMYKDYKANRDATPEDIKKAVPWIKDILEAYGIPVYEAEGFEADDLIGTMSRQAADMGFTTYMMTPDKDFTQLVNETVKMYKPATRGGAAVVMGPGEVCREYSIEDPKQIIDILALMGDSADNIPGAPGIGPKTAKKLISEFGSVENLIKNSDKLTGKQKEIIENNSEEILFSKKLVTIETDVPFELNEEEMLRKEMNRSRLRDLFSELEFRSLAEKLDAGAAEKGAGETGAAPRDSGSLQGSLFETAGVPVNKAGDLETLNDRKHDYARVETKNEMKELADKLMKLDEFCFDTETSSLNALEAELIAISFSWENNKGYLVYFEDDKAVKENIDIFKEVFESEKSLKIGQNLKFDIQVLNSCGIEVKGKLFDTMIAHYLLEPDMRHNMDYLAETYLKYKPIAIESLIGEKGKKQKSMRTVAVDKLTEYAVEDADITYQLKQMFYERLESENLLKLAMEIEMPLIPVLAEMERSGVILNKESLKEYSGVLREKIKALEEEIYKLAGAEFNIGSPRQLGDILFKKLKLDDKAKKTKTNQYVTNEEALQRLNDRHPIISKVLGYRGLKKLLSTYVEALPELISSKTGKLHTSYNQAVASTGRLSSNNPNLQNIPIRDESGREIRKAFVPAEGNVFLSADYSQIELRLMAHLSGDRGMKEDFLGGQDIHSATAAKIFGVKPEDVSREMRAKAKTANFGIIYGISAFGLSQRLNISRSEAKDLIDGYFESYPGVKKYMDKSIEKGRKDAYVTTMFGRKRYLRDIQSRNSLLRSNAERNAINAPIQGSAADIIKIAMINIHNKLKKSGLKASMILQVHDELIFELAVADKEELRDLVVKEMEQACKLDVPLVVEHGFGKNWLEAH
ncbi:MAG: DNA polymerase I [Bacteroidales bacterium]|nr:DNA polymerase I [Bacteroidales bacterium]